MRGAIALASLLIVASAAGIAVADGGPPAGETSKPIAAPAPAGETSKPIAAPAPAGETPKPIAASVPATLAIGSTMPLADVSMAGVDGRSLTLAGAAGKKGTLVIFMCRHCPWVKSWQDRIASIGNAAVKRGLGVIAVNSNDPAAYPEDDVAGMKEQAKQLSLAFPYVVDGTSDVARAFGATRTPEAFLFDAHGKLVYHGTVDDNAHEPQSVKNRWLADAVTAVAAGNAVPTAETKAFGCGIKYRAKTGT